MVPLRKSTYCNTNNTTNENMEDSNNYDEKSFNIGDDEELKRARRRMKNKISAQESRRRKKEYVDALELKMKQRDQEKKLLTEKVTELEEKVRLLVDELFQLKQNQNEQVSSSTSETSTTSVSISTQTGICLNCFQQSSYDNRHGKDEIRHLTGDFETTRHNEYISHMNETNVADLDSRCHELSDRSDRKQEDDITLYEEGHRRIHENNSLSSPLERFRPENNGLSERTHSPKYFYESIQNQHFYYDKPYTRRTTSASPRLTSLSSRVASASPPTRRSDAAPIRRMSLSPRRHSPSALHSEERAAVTSHNALYYRRNLPSSLYSQLMETTSTSDHILSPQ